MIRYLIILLVATSNTFGQQLEFRGRQVEAISIVGNSGHYSMDERIFRYETDSLLMTYKSHRGKHLVEYVEKYEKRYLDSVKKKLNTFKRKQFKNIEIDTALLAELLVTLDNRKNEVKLSDLGLSIDDFKQKVSPRKIRSEIIKQKERWQLRLGEKEWVDGLLSGASDVDTFNAYLEKVFSMPKLVDVWMPHATYEVLVTIQTDSAVIKFKAAWPYAYMQPVIEYTDVANPEKISAFTNVAVNIALLNILPKYFCSRKGLELDKVFDRYIKWYLDKMDIGSYKYADIFGRDEYLYE